MIQTTTSAGIAQNPMLAAVYYEYGGMKNRGYQKTKCHIADDYGKPLCGVKSNWMEAGEPISKDGFIKGFEHLFPITDKRNCTCQKCFKNWVSANVSRPDLG